MSVMTYTISIAQLRARGVTLTPTEAVAVCQTLIHSEGTPKPHPPFGPPTADTLFVADDGSVVCLSCAATPAVSELARLLQTLLPDGTAAVPGGLRYAIGRALLDVEAAPFDSLADFSHALERYEHGPRNEVIRGLVKRAGERRRNGPSTTELRRQLREMDRQLYEASVAAHEGRNWQFSLAGPVAACLLTSVALMGAGHVMDPRRAPASLPAPAIVRATAPAGLQLLAADRDRAARLPQVPLVDRSPSLDAAIASPGAAKPARARRPVASRVSKADLRDDRKPPALSLQPAKPSLPNRVVTRIRFKWEEL
jgi:hypothetical protein